MKYANSYKQNSLGKVIDFDLSKRPWNIVIEPAKGKKKLLKKIINSPLTSGINYLIKSQKGKRP